MKRNLRIILILTSITITISLVISYPLNWGVSDKLGNGFIVTTDKSLLYQDANGEYFVLPFGVSKYAYDKKWIIVKTEGVSFKRSLIDSSSNSVNYWIINKDTPIHHNELDSIVLYLNGNDYHIVTNGLIGPLDSISFLRAMRANNIFLKIE